MLRGLKTTFLVHALVALVFGMIMFVAPDLLRRMSGLTQEVEPAVVRAYGAATLAMALSSWLGFRATHWEEVRILVEMEIAYTVLATAGLIYSLVVNESAATPMVIWALVVMYVAFAIAWIYYFWRERAGASTAHPGASGTTLGSTPMT